MIREVSCSFHIELSARRESLICAPVTTAPNSQAQTAPLMPMARSD